MNSPPMRRLRLTWGGATDQGRIRANNQDAMYADSALFVVADEMGGHQGGEVAANLAVRTVAN
ncbi:MAG TPA: serine/threonine-protein phosphatase, partial [Acidimicrobiaceae bacterium]|nr:serine/threonine-protein phosphatase [Acidimicrobiaceae bacterium]